MIIQIDGNCFCCNRKKCSEDEENNICADELSRGVQSGSQEKGKDKIVVFPDPFGPTRPNISFPVVRVRLSTANRSPKRLVRFWVTSIWPRIYRIPSGLKVMRYEGNYRKYL